MDSNLPNTNNNSPPNLKLKSHLIDPFNKTIPSNLMIDKTSLPDTQLCRWTIIKRIFKLIFIVLVLVGLFLFINYIRQDNYTSFIAHASGTLAQIEIRTAKLLSDKLNLRLPSIFNYKLEPSPTTVPEYVESHAVTPTIPKPTPTTKALSIKSTNDYSELKLLRQGCTTPIQYKIGRIDSQFDISIDELLAEMAQAIKSWNNIKNHEYFTYNPNGTLAINLVYDERQQLVTDVKNMEYDQKNLYNKIQTENTEYKDKGANVNQKETALNAEIASYSQKNISIPQDVADSFKVREDEINQLITELNTLGNTLNSDLTTYSSQSYKLAQNSNLLNRLLRSDSAAGYYRGKDNSITIYVFNTKNMLIHILAHELGHALGIPHNSNSNSIMFPTTSEIMVPSPDDLEALKKVCSQ